MRNHTQQRAAALVQQAAQAQEAVIEDEISKYDALLNDDEALQALRARRLQQLQQAQKQKQHFQSLGHGTYHDLDASRQTNDVAKAFFTATKESPRLVVHFYRPSTPLCDVFHKHLAVIAKKHAETRFCKINVQDCDSDAGNGAAFLVERLNVVVMPTLLLIKDKKVIHEMRGLEEVGGGTDCSFRALEYILQQHGVIDRLDDEDDDEPPEELLEAVKGGLNKIRISSQSIRRSRGDDDSDEDF